MYQDVNFYQFSKGFDIRPTSFTYDGLKALFEYLTDFEADSESPIEFDPIALCCEYTEYEDLAEFQDNYGDEYKSIENIADNTSVIPINDESFIVADF